MQDTIVYRNTSTHMSMYHFNHFNSRAIYKKICKIIIYAWFKEMGKMHQNEIFWNLQKASLNQISSTFVTDFHNIPHNIPIIHSLHVLSVKYAQKLLMLYEIRESFVFFLIRSKNPYVAIQPMDTEQVTYYA
jgi:hypothetical protein